MLTETRRLHPLTEVVRFAPEYVAAAKQLKQANAPIPLAKAGASSSLIRRYHSSFPQLRSMRAMKEYERVIYVMHHPFHLQ